MKSLVHSLIELLFICTAFAPGLNGQTAPAASSDFSILDRLPAPTLMQGIGDATLRITTTSPQVQAYFNQGLRLLHDFWYFEAYRAFRESARLDPSAGMAYWGMARALSNYPQMAAQAAEAIEKAKGLMNKVSPLEQHYIRAGAALIESPGDQGRDAYVQEMQALIKEYPTELNAPAFLALVVMSGFDSNGRATPGEVYAQELLHGILASHPENVAANHYWIHSVEGGPDPQSGLASVAVLLRGAPNAPHIVHMGGHVAFRLGDYEGARKYFLDSLKVDEAYLAREHVPASYEDNFAHNQSYLAAACAEAGRRQEATAWAKKLSGLAAPPDLAASALNYAIPVGSTLLRVHLRFGDFNAAMDDKIEFGGLPVDEAAKEYEQGLHAYAQGMALMTGETVNPAVREARAGADELGKIVESLQTQAPQPRALTGGTTSPAAYWVGGAARLLEGLSHELDGFVGYREKDVSMEDSISFLNDAVKMDRELGYTEPPYSARPPIESLGDLFLRNHSWELAREAYQQELQIRPKSGFALFGIARSYELQGQTNEATQAYKQFLAAWPYADNDLPQVRDANKWIARHAAVHGN